ncbi:MAG: alkaline phosphatase family protein [Thermoplasmatales archaeon]|nr:alkaline phosphatase family protein [Candidatus Thermoplasmatota archaeon]MCL6002787.1 alkaline phosphatase family protein [Candidatus Thermoplasmatota archaeon]MDA8056138.1 alkaline phosphatase family protein [Thermoplasmatales archaeon]
MKVVVIGIDGACWDPILPYIDKGELNGYAQFWKNGLHGSLLSTIPYLTQPAWKSYSIGKNPGKTGVYHWSRIDWKELKFRSLNSTSFHGDDYWDILSQKGHRVSIIDMPSTFPPDKVNGIMISGMNHGDGPWTYPEEFEKNIPSWFVKDGIHLFRKNQDPEVTMNGIESEIKSRFDMAEMLWDADLVHLSVEMNDHVSHFMWNNDHIMYRNFRANDEGIQRVLNKNKEGYTILMSDHGNGPIEDEFYTNEFLAREGFLSLQESDSRGVSRESIVDLGTKLKLDRLVNKLPNSLQNRIVKRIKAMESVMETDPEKRINWKESKVVALDEGMLYVNPLYDDEKSSILEELTNRFKSLRSKSGKNVIKNVLRGNEIYWGPYVSDGPDLVTISNEIYHQRLPLSGYVWASDIPEESWGYRFPQVGHHRIKGIFGLVGPGIAAKEVNASIYDLAPTILKLFGADIPNDVDGKPLV